MDETRAQIPQYQTEESIKEEKVETTKGRMGYRKHNFSESAKAVILTTYIMTDLRKEKI